MLRNHAQAALVQGFGLLLLLLPSACSSKSDNNADPNTDAAATEVSCEQDPRVETYAPGMTKLGKLGVLSFSLSASDPAPPAKGSNTFQLQVLDADQAPVQGDLSVDLTMPDHGHGTTVAPKVTYDDGSQAFTISPLYLFMPGVWRIDFGVSSQDSDPKAKVDDTSFFFCIEG